MARYIDADDLLKTLELSIKSWSRDCNSNAPKMVLAYKDVVERIKLLPTADVAPRAEVAREILAQIEKAVAKGFEYGTFFDVQKNLAELKKKYTEE